MHFVPTLLLIQLFFTRETNVEGKIQVVRMIWRLNWDWYAKNHFQE